MRKENYELQTGFSFRSCYDHLRLDPVGVSEHLDGRSASHTPDSDCAQAMTDEEFDLLIEESMHRQKFASGAHRNKAHLDRETKRCYFYLDESLFTLKTEDPTQAPKAAYNGKFGPMFDDYYGEWPNLSCPA